MATNLTHDDLDQLKERGISPETVEAQLERFRAGFPYLRIDAPSSVDNGILVVEDELADDALARWQEFLASGGDVLKFVPASGAASRMFKAMFEFVNGDASTPAPGTPAAQIIDNLEHLAFFPELDATCRRLYGRSCTELRHQGRGKDIIAALILPQGMNYGALPKAVLTFHAYPDGTTRTALEEQLAEGAQYAASANGKVRLHFTVSADHLDLFREKLAVAVPEMEKRLGVSYDISLSVQKPSTDTIAATPDNEPFRDADGRLVFRPGGHGALIENLSDIDATVVFIKNIDNVVADAHRADTVRYKKILGGMLLLVEDEIREHLRALNETYDESEDLEEAVLAATDFVEDTLSTHSTLLSMTQPLQKRWAELNRILRRPLRVCGMVRNEGEPGGGPYNAWSTDGTTLAPQILESTQIDLSRPENVEMMKTATHFNPVDLVCYLKDTDGKHFDLRTFVDPATGFISEKSLGGRPLRALELPGLWNGAMSNWNTVFVEVPASTFNPVKTVNDLLRPAHQ
ncbi:MAG: DUF4301 family protein [Muribaculaceae bacterium]|nr:DUF4301 family protein [Muribaculaceae bacterium]